MRPLELVLFSANGLEGDAAMDVFERLVPKVLDLGRACFIEGMGDISIAADLQELKSASSLGRSAPSARRPTRRRSSRRRAARLVRPSASARAARSRPSASNTRCTTTNASESGAACRSGNAVASSAASSDRADTVSLGDRNARSGREGACHSGPRSNAT